MTNPNAAESWIRARRAASPPLHRTCGLALIVLLSACARAAAPVPVVPPQDRVILVVENASWSDVTIHLLHGGTPLRLGSVSSMRPAEFLIPAVYVMGATDITLALSPLGSQESFVLAPIMVYPSSTVRLQAAKTLSFSTLALRGSERF